MKKGNLIIDKEQYKEVLICDVCSKKGKLVLPIEYMFRFIDRDLNTINKNNSIKNICHQCASEILNK